MKKYRLNTIVSKDTALIWMSIVTFYCKYKSIFNTDIVNSVPLHFPGHTYAKRDLVISNAVNCMSLQICW